MSKNSTLEAYEKAKAKHKAIALEKEKMIQQDLSAIRRKMVPRHLKKKFLTGCAIFGVVYLAEELLLRKKVPGIVKFLGAVAATAMTPKVFPLIQGNFLVVEDVAAIGAFSTPPSAPKAPPIEDLPEEDDGKDLTSPPEASIH